MTWFRDHKFVGIGLMAIISVVCSVVFLAQSAPRDWALHWIAPQTVIASVATSTDYASASTSHGFDVLWVATGNRLFLSRFDRNGHRQGGDISINGSPQSVGLGVVGNTDVAVWREDTNGGSQLRAAIVRGAQPPLYRTLASGTGPLEHPYAFNGPHGVDVVFSWQRQQVYDIYLSRVSATGQASSPVQLTHASQYAYNPHAAFNAQGNIDLLFMDMCCSGNGFRMVHAQYTPTGTLLLRQQVATILSTAGQGSGGTPTSWGLDVRRDGKQVWATWTGDQGIVVAAWRGTKETVQPQVVVPMENSEVVALATLGGRRLLLWRQAFDLGFFVAVMPIDSQGLPVAAPDRVAYESDSADLPQPVVAAGQPAVLWQAQLPKSDVSQLHLSHYTPHTQGPPNVWARLGLGLSNPVLDLLLLLIAGMAVGVLITFGNILIVLGLSVIYVIVGRIAGGRWKWYAYAGLLAVVLFALLVRWGAPSPPILFLTALSSSQGLLAIGGMMLFVVLLAVTALQRLDDFYRAAIMAFAALYFIAFLEALTMVEGQIGKI